MKCIKCGESRESEFSLEHINKHDYRCKTCVRRWEYEYRQKHREKHLKYLHEYYLAHKEQLKKKSVDYLSTPEGKERHKRHCQASHARVKLKVLSHYSNGSLQCAICGFNDSRALCIDHINNCGMEKRLLTGGGGRKLAVYLYRNKFPSGYQVLCANCNLIKEIERRKVEGLKVANCATYPTR